MGARGSVLLAAVVLLLAVTGAAVGGPWELEVRSFWLQAPVEPTDAPSVAAALEPLPPSAGAPGSTADLGWLLVVMRILLVLAAAAAGLWWLWRQVRRLYMPRRLPPTREADALALGVEEPDVPVLRRGVAEAQRSLAEMGPPGDAVIAAWLALEEAAADSGVRRAGAQTPTEFTVAVLEQTDADPDATTELLGLYHQARFSRLPMGPAHVERASHCLARLAANWDAAANEAVR